MLLCPTEFSAYFWTLNLNLHWACLETFLLPFRGDFGAFPTISTYSKAAANGLKTYEYQNTTGNIQFAQQYSNS
jgi:hypothetical protein